MNIGKKDLSISEMENKININHNSLLKKYKILEKNKNNDIYTNELYNNYKDYFDNIDSIKNNQLIAFRNIEKYLDKIIKTLPNNCNLLEEAKYDKKEILDEINKLNN